jgi:hypothetical protein
VTCAALPDGSLKRGNYASRVRPSAPDGPHAPKRKTIGSDRAAENPRGLFSERKLHAFHGVSALGNDDEKPEEQRAMFLSRPRASKGKKNFARSTRRENVFPKNCESE